jgi:hypothetical protein
LCAFDGLSVKLAHAVFLRMMHAELIADLGGQPGDTLEPEQMAK